MSSFQRNTGAAADVKEIEYIAALHQTCMPDMRANGTVSSTDIQALLSSRYGLHLSHTACISILRGLGGGMSRQEVYVKDELAKHYQEVASALTKENRLQSLLKRGRKNKPSDIEESEEGEVGEDEKKAQEEVDENQEEETIPEEYLDLVQILAILFIPTLARAGARLQKTTEEETKSDEASKEKTVEILTDILHVLNRNVQRQRTDDQTYNEKVFPDLDVQLIEDILLECGEVERVENRELLEEMVQVARSSTGKLDVEAFINAVTSDLDLWPVEGDGRVSTFFYDVFGQTRAEANNRIGDDGCFLGTRGKEAEEEAQEPSDQGQLSKENSLDHSDIDFVIDIHGSVWAVVVIWFFYLMATITYGSIFQSLVSAPCEDEVDSDDFSCLLSSQLWNWLVIAIFLSLFGVVIVLPLSLGNNPETRSPRRLALVTLISGLYTVVPYGTVRGYIDNSEEPYDAGEERANTQFFEGYLSIVFVTGCILTLYYAGNLISLLVYGATKPTDSFWWTPSNTIGESRLKKAADHKIRNVIFNAHKLHQFELNSKEQPMLKNSSSSLRSRASNEIVDHTMLNYVLNGQETDEAGGLIWTWKRLLSGELFEADGVWLPTRMIVFQGAQVLILVVLVLIYIAVIRYAADEAEKAQGSLPDDLPDWARQIVPTPSDVRIALYPAAVISIIVMVILVLIYIPSSTGTILLYRSGQMPSLGSTYFRKYRQLVGNTYMNTGNAVYGLFGAGSLFFLLIALVIFLFIWDFSRELMVKLVAWGLGLSLTIGLKMVFTKTFHTNNFRSFYRIRPRKSNLASLALECWFIGLGSSVLIGRISQFLFAAVFWVGRIDVPFLSEDVALMGYAFDYVPSNYAKELLVHEAHRHPYIERLAQMYLMRFRHRERFCSNAGAVWRHIFVQTLMPWMRKHRVLSQARLKQAMEALDLDKKMAAEDSKGLFTRLGEDMEAVKGGFTDIATEGITQVTSTAAGVAETLGVVKDAKHIEEIDC